MTYKTETVAEVLAEMAQDDKGENSWADGWNDASRHYRARIERALSAQPAVAWQFRDMQWKPGEWADITRAMYESYESGNATGKRGKDWEIRALYATPQPAKSCGSVPDGHVLIERADLVGIARILERDGDEHGAARELRNLLRAAPPASTPQPEPKPAAVEVTEEMVERFARRHYEITGRSIDRAYTFACLTDALQEPRHD